MISSDLGFYLAAVPAVLLTGIGKSGFGGVALMAVPLLSLVMSPIEAAALMLPLLLMMDVFGVYAWRGQGSWAHIKVLVPGAAFGVLIGMLTAQFVNPDMVKLIVGIIAVGFCLYQWLPKPQKGSAMGQPNWLTGSVAGAASGYTSYIAHAGSPPYHMYLIPKGLDPRAFAATGAWYFFIVNGLKLPAYIAVGQFSLEVFMQALVMLPLVPIGVYAGVWLNKRVSHDLFYKFIYGFVFLIGFKLIYDSL